MRRESETSDALRAITIADDENKRQALVVVVEEILTVKEADERTREVAQRARLADRRRADAGR